MKKITILALVLITACAKPDGVAKLERMNNQAVQHRPIFMNKPDFKKWQESAITIHADVGKDGRLTKCVITPGSNPDFNAMAVNYCKTARYKPAYKNGEPVVERGRIIVLRFHRED